MPHSCCKKNSWSCSLPNVSERLSSKKMTEFPASSSSNLSNRFSRESRSMMKRKIEHCCPKFKKEYRKMLRPYMDILKMKGTRRRFLRKGL